MAEEIIPNSILILINDQYFENTHIEQALLIKDLAMFVCAYVCVCTLILIVAEWILIFLLLENYGSLLWTTFFVQMDLKLLKSGGYIYLSILVI